jgi:hypothetical protein
MSPLNPHPPVGFVAPASPPQATPATAKKEDAKPRGNPILHLAQKFWPQTAQKPGQAGPPSPPEVAPIAPPKPAPPVPQPSNPPEVIRIEATKEPGTWTFSTPASPIGIEGMVRAASPRDAIQTVSEAIRGLRLLCNSPEGLVSLALLVDPAALVANTILTPDIRADKEGQNGQVHAQVV